MVGESLAFTDLFAQMQGRTPVRPEVLFKGDRMLGDFKVGEGHGGKMVKL